MEFSDGAEIDLTSSDLLNGVPVITIDDAIVGEDGYIEIDVIAGVFDADGDEVSIASFTQGENGKVEFINGKLRYIPNSNFYGEDQFNYSVIDASGVAVTAALIVSVLSDGITEISRNIYKEKYLKPGETVNFSLDQYLKDFDNENIEIIVTLSNGELLPEVRVGAK